MEHNTGVSKISRPYMPRSCLRYVSAASMMLIEDRATVPTTSVDEGTGEHKPADGDMAAGSVDLPLHLTEKILCCISPLESARFATVCKSWAATVSERLANPVPHLLAFGEYYSEIVYVPMDADDARHRRPTVTRARSVDGLAERRLTCIGATSSGCCIILKSSTRSAWIESVVNPVTGAQTIISKFSRPCLGTNDVLGPVFSTGDRSYIYIGREIRREDFPLPPQRFLLVYRDLRMSVRCDGGLYALDRHGYVVRVNGEPVDTGAARLEFLPVPSLMKQYHCPPDGTFLDKGYLVESDGEVLFVGPSFVTARAMSVRPYAGFLFKDVLDIGGFEVYRLDTKEQMRWVKVERLPENRALFVSRLSSFSVPASEMGCKSNCIYFVTDKRKLFNRWGVYSLGERKVLVERHLGSARYNHMEGMWFFPTVHQHGDGAHD